jgi:glyoxylase-like metal-dependent hydrolase (beta-lactamase superfamily II)
MSVIRVHAIDTGYFKLDGGAMFGVVPKKIWQKLNLPDDNNLCRWAMRCLLVETEDRLLLIDTGIGSKQDDKFRSHFEPHGDASLQSSLRALGYTAADITDVLLTHLHFDHVGGAVDRLPDGRLQPAFPNARYWSNEQHWRWACAPNAREAASFLRENFMPLQEAGQLHFVPPPDRYNETDWLPGIRLRWLYGHTEAMMMPIIDWQGHTLAYCADLIPSSFHLRMPYVMAYDLRPLLTLEEKQRLLAEAADQGWLLFFEHDPLTACLQLQRGPDGQLSSLPPTLTL